MRVTIDHRGVRRGFIFRRLYHEVAVTVAMSHEEKQIVISRRLHETVLLKRRPATAKVDDRDEKFTLRLGDLLHGQTDRFLTATPSQAKIYEEELVALFAQVKRYIADNAETGTRTVVEF